MAVDTPFRESTSTVADDKMAERADKLPYDDGSGDNDRHSMARLS